MGIMGGVAIIDFWVVKRYKLLAFPLNIRILFKKTLRFFGEIEWGESLDGPLSFLR